jgi:hypothetical protein
MTNGEIRAIQFMVKSAISKRKFLWEHHYARKLGELDEVTNEFRLGKKGRYSPTRDKRLPVYMPKIFRRQYKFEIGRNGKSFKTFLSNEKPLDKCYLLEDFFKEGKNNNNVMNLSNFFNSNGDILFKPWEVVFEEAESKLVDTKTKKAIRNPEF